MAGIAMAADWVNAFRGGRKIGVPPFRLAAGHGGVRDVLWIAPSINLDEELGLESRGCTEWF
jgi:hypothetical protein